MTDKYQDFTERLSELILETGCLLQHQSMDPLYVQQPMRVEVTSVQEANCSESILKVHAISHDDPVLAPDDSNEIQPEEKGVWNRREVGIQVNIPIDSSSRITVALGFSTTDADDAGNRTVLFHWEFDDVGDPRVAEMWLRDSKTFKLDCVNVLPPEYVRAFVCLCVQAYDETF